MKVLNLRCAHQHVFEGWFGGEDDFQSQFERGLVECPVCADKAIIRLPSAPRLNLSRERATEAGGPSGAVAPSSAEPKPAPDLQSLWLQAVQHVMHHTDDVGERFTEEARRMHYGEAPERAIRGQASAQETQALRDEGIEVMALPIPAALKGPVQ